MEVTCKTSDEDKMAGKRKTRGSNKSTSTQEKHVEDTVVSSPESARSGSGSPEPNCAICLGKLQNKSFTDSCFHMFCFTCLLEWSKVKAVCPLCKQAFKSIIHNVRSNQEYDQYHLRPEESGSPDGGRFRYRTTLTTDRWMFRQQMEQQRQLQLLQRPTTQTVRSQWRRMRQAATSAFRQRVYNENMRVRDLSHPPNRPPRYRNISVAFFKRNPAASHRLVPWLNRELNVVLHGREDHVQFVMELIMDLIKRFDIQSEEFLEHIRSFMGRRSEHFVHEFYNFARSPFDMVAYDSHAIYDEPEPHVHSIENDSSDNDDVILVSPSERSSHHSQDQSISNPEPPSLMVGDTELSPLLHRVRDFLAFIDTSQPGGWDSPLPGPSSLRWSPVTAPFSEIVGETNASSNSQRDSYRTSGRETIQVSPSDSNHQSEEDDVMIVGVEKAWESRTPIQLSSDEESPEKQNSSPAKRKHRKNHEKEKDEGYKRRKEKSLRKKRTRSRSSERHSSQPRSTRSRSRERHHHSPCEKQRQSDSSPEEIKTFTSRDKPRHYRFSSTSPSKKRSQNYSSEHGSRSSGGRSHSSGHSSHHSVSSRSPNHRRRRDRTSPLRRNSSSPEYCGSSRKEDARSRSSHNSSSSSNKKHKKSRRSQSPSSSVDNSSKKSKQGSRKRHRIHSTSSIETVYENSYYQEKHKSHKRKKHKKHKKNKSKDKERKTYDVDSSSGVEILEIMDDEVDRKSCGSPDSDHHQWKKHPTGHKKSSKSKSGQCSDAGSSGIHTGHSSDTTSANAGEVSTPSSSSYDNSKWRPIGQTSERQENENSDKHSEAQSASDNPEPEATRAITSSSVVMPSSSSNQSPPSEYMSTKASVESDPGETGACNYNSEADSSPMKNSKLLNNLENQESLHEIEKTMRANILNRLSCRNDVNNSVS